MKTTYYIVLISEKPEPKFGSFDGIERKIMKYLEFKKARQPFKDEYGDDCYGLRNGLTVFVSPKEDSHLRLEVHGDPEKINKSIEAIAGHYGGLIGAFGHYHCDPSCDKREIEIYFGGERAEAKRIKANKLNYFAVAAVAEGTVICCGDDRFVVPDESTQLK